MAFIPPFHPHSEALMSNLASRSHEWKDWEIEELLVEFPTSAKSRGKRSPHFRILLRVSWVDLGLHTYVISCDSSPTRTLLDRKSINKDSLRSARILARRTKSSNGSYFEESSEVLDKYLTQPLT